MSNTATATTDTSNSSSNSSNYSAPKSRSDINIAYTPRSYFVASSRTSNEKFRNKKKLSV